MYSSHLFHYALVNEEFSHTRDITSSIIPLIKPLLEEKNGEKYQPEEIAKNVSDVYGIDMHPYVAEDIADKLIEKKWLRSIGENRNTKKNEYEICIYSNNTSEESDEISTVIQEIINVYKKTSKAFFSNANIPEPAIDYENEFSRRLANSIIEKDQSLETNFEDILDYAFGQTIAMFYEAKGREYQVLESAYSGAVLAEVVLSIREPSVEIENIKDKKFYIDAPLLINALGFHEEYLVNCTRELIKYVTENGGIVTTTAAYIEEAEKTLMYGLKSYIEKHRNPSHLTRFLMKNPNQLSKMQAAKGNLTYLLKKIGFNLGSNLINVTKRDQSQTFSSFRSRLSENLSWIKVEETMEHDVEAVLHVVSDYNYHSFKSFAESKSFLITPNERLIKDSIRTLQEHGNFKTYEMSPILSERKFAVLMWVLTGTKSDKNLSSLSLLTNCSKAMRGHALLITKVKSFFNELDQDSSELFERVVTNDRLLHTMVQEVGGNTDIITKKSFSSYVKKAEDTIQKEIDGHLEKVNKSEEKLSLARKAISQQSRKIQENSENESFLINEMQLIKESERQAKLVASEESSKARAEKIRALEAENSLKEIGQEKGALIDEVAKLKEKMAATNRKNLNKRRKRYEKSIELVFKLIIVILGCVTIYMLNSYSSEFVVGYVSKENASIFAIIIGFCYTYVAPQLLFDKPISAFSRFLSFKIIKK